jgi:hypothetical protein
MVLIAGGGAISLPSDGVSSAEVYNPSTGAFTVTDNMTIGRVYHTATLLNNGMVLMVGGLGSGGTVLSSAEIYNPSTGTFTATGSMSTPREDHTATLLTNGKVLITGGFYTTNANNILSSAEIYDPTTGTYTRALQTATLLNNGLVLVAGSYNGNGKNAELYNPSTGTFSITGALTVSRNGQTATLLGNGMVLLAGGGGFISSAELYNPTTGTFAATGSMTEPHFWGTATLLNNGKVLVAGGRSSLLTVNSTAELYDPAAGTFSLTGSMITARSQDAAVLLSNGMVLVEGGTGSGWAILSSSELYNSVGVTGYINPKFLVVGVVYAPPGPSSNTWVSYTNSTTLGTTTSVSSSFMTGDTLSTSSSSGFSIPLVGSAKITNQSATTTSQGTNSASTFSMSFQTSATEKSFGTPNYYAPVVTNNDYDAVCVWLNPAVIFTLSNNTIVWNGYGADKTDQPGMDIQCIPVGDWNGDFGPMPAQYTGPLSRSWAANQVYPAGQGSALTTADYAQIASADPFSNSAYGPNNIGADPPSPQTPDYRFTMSTCTANASFDYDQAAPSQTPSIYSCTLTYTNMSSQAQGITSSYSQTFSTDAAFNGSNFLQEFSLDVKNSSTLTWTTGAQSTISNSTGSTAAFSVQGPPCNNQVQGQGPCIPVYDSSGTEPTQFYVYEDNMFGSFMFAPVHFY